jgi:hypothetical protein
MGIVVALDVHRKQITYKMRLRRPAFHLLSPGSINSRRARRNIQRWRLRAVRPTSTPASSCRARPARSSVASR